MKIKSYIGLCLIIAMLSACSSPLPSDKLNYAGKWISADSRVRLTISENGRVEYNNDQMHMKTAVSAPIKDFSKSGFATGLGPISTNFDVKTPPYQDNQGNWFMNVNGFTLAKIPNE